MDTSGTRSFKFFVSYSRADSKSLQAVLAELEAVSIKYFLDEKDVIVGEDIRYRVTQGIDRCDFFMVYLSPATEKSSWVPFEIGLAIGKGRKVIVVLDHPEMELPPILANIKCIISIDLLRDELAKLISSESDDYTSQMSPLEFKCKDVLYYHPYGYIPAIRLFGADDDYITDDRLVVSYIYDHLSISSALQDQIKRVIEIKRSEAHKRGAPFFNGPNTRLLSWIASPRGQDAATERKTLELVLGPVSWYEYEGLNEAIRPKDPSESIPVSDVEYHIKLQELISKGDVHNSKLSNIIDTAATIVSSDGFVAFQERGERVSAVPGKMTSSVAENINRYLDDTVPTDSTQLINSYDTRELDISTIDVDYRPQGVPHPFSAVRRGIAEELSPLLMEYLPKHGIKLTGLAYDLEALHPDALFIVLIKLSCQEILDLCISKRGKDWTEGSVRFVKLDPFDEEAKSVLMHSNWVAAGKASLVRAMELVSSIQRNLHCSTIEAIDYLSEVA